MRLARAATGELLADDLRTAGGLLGRMRGLMGKRAMPGGGLLIEPADSIHTCFMRMAIDLLFLGRDGRILKICPAVPPWRIRLAPAGARRVLEMPAGWADSHKLAPHDSLTVLP
jgi:hypothetical protein